MKKRFLLTGLVIPLGGVAIALVIASLFVCDPWRSLSVNLAAGLLGSIITVLYVDKIIRRNEHLEWMKVLKHVGRQVNILANATSSSVRVALALKLPRPSPEDAEIVNDPKLMRAWMRTVIEHELLPRISQLPEMNQKSWQTFANSMAGSMKDAERILTLFGRNLDSTIMGLILDIHEHARALLSHYQLWPDMLGIPLSQLPPNNRGESMVSYFEATYKLIVQDADQLLRICATLLSEIDSRFPDSKQS